MLYKFNEIDENLKILCNYGCGKKFKYKDGLFTYDKLNNTLHFYCEKCAKFINELYYQHLDEYDKEGNIPKFNENVETGEIQPRGINKELNDIERRKLEKYFKK